MNKICSILAILAFINAFSGRLITHRRVMLGGERQLKTDLVTTKTTANRKLGLEDDLQREHEDEQNLNNTKLMMINMKKEGEIRGLESIINEIGDRVEEINDTIRAKTNEFIDKVDSVRKSRNSNQKLITVKKEGQ
jgi:hypothetical protein